MLTCKKCSHKTIVKNGFVRNKQRYKCKNCGHNFICGDTRSKHETEIKKALSLIIFLITNIINYSERLYMENKKNEFFDNSKIASYINCPREFYYSWERRIVLDKPNIHLDFGSVLHKALEVGYKELKENRDSLILDNDLIKSTFQDELEKKEFSENEDKNLINGLKALDIFLSTENYWSFEQGLGNFRIVDVENILSNEYLNYTGKIDLIIETKDKIFVIDHKTTGRLDFNKLNRWRLDRGIIGYNWLVKENIKTDKPIISLINLLYLAAENTQKSRGTNSVIQIQFNYTKEQLTIWQQETIYWLDAIKASKKNNFWPKAANKCQIFSCDYFGLCEQGREIGKEHIGGWYVEKEKWYC